MKKKLLFGVGVVAVFCIALLTGGSIGSAYTQSSTEERLDRSPILGFDAVPGAVYLEIHRDVIETNVPRGAAKATLAKFTITNNGQTNISIDYPRLYATADRPFVLKENVKEVALRSRDYLIGDENRRTIDIPSVLIGNGIQFTGVFTVLAHSSVEIFVVGDVLNSATINALSLEPDILGLKSASPLSQFVVAYSSNLSGDRLGLAPFNLTGEAQAVCFAGTSCGVETSTASNVDYAKCYWNIKGTLTAPYIPEGSIMRSETGIDVYIIKYNNGKRFKRLILSPAVFDSYQHLKWYNVLIVNDIVMDSYTNSNYVRVAGDGRIWRLEPMGDVGKKTQVNYSDYDLDSVYEINAADRDSYAQNTDTAEWIEETDEWWRLGQG